MGTHLKQLFQSVILGRCLGGNLGQSSEVVFWCSAMQSSGAIMYCGHVRLSLKVDLPHVVWASHMWWLFRTIMASARGAFGDHNKLGDLCLGNCLVLTELLIYKVKVLVN